MPVILILKQKKYCAITIVFNSMTGDDLKEETIKVLKKIKNAVDDLGILMSSPPNLLIF